MKNIIAMEDLTCPISTERVDENTTRVVAAIVVIIGVITLYTQNPAPALLLALDFSIRAFTKKPYSLLRLIARNIAAVLHLKEKPIDAAPKKFAAGVGFVFSIVIAIALLTGFVKTAFIAGSILLVCAVLESAFAYCVGCVVYTYLVLPILNKL